MRDTACPRSEPGDAWDEVWDAYEARQIVATTGLPPAGAALLTAASASPSRGRLRAVLLLAGIFALGCLAGSVWPLLLLHARVMRNDVPAVLQALDAAPARAALREALRAHAGLPPGGGGDAAARMLGAMADAMANDLATPGALHRMVATRNAPLDPRTGRVRDAAAGPLTRLAATGATELTLAPAGGTGGLRLWLAFGTGGWQARDIAMTGPAMRVDAARLRLTGPGAGRGTPPA